MFRRIHAKAGEIRRSPAPESGEIRLRFAHDAAKFRKALELIPATGSLELSKYADFVPTAEFFKNGRRIWERNGKGFSLEFEFVPVEGRPAVLVEFKRIVNT